MDVDSGRYSRGLGKRRLYRSRAPTRARLARGRRLRMPYSRTVSRPTSGRTFSAKNTVVGSTKYNFIRPGRDFPLYAPPAAYAPQEMHLVDLPLATYAMNLTGSITFLPLIALGDGIHDRSGTRVMLTGLQVRGKVVPQAGTVYASGSWMIVYDLLPRGALPAITDIMDTIDFNSFQKTDNRDRFQILCRYNYSQSGVLAAPSVPAANVDRNLSMRLQVAFGDGLGGNIAGCKAGALYLVTVGDQLAAGNLGLNLICTTRLQFSDSG